MLNICNVEIYNIKKSFDLLNDNIDFKRIKWIFHINSGKLSFFFFNKHIFTFSVITLVF